jgi:myo-inositol-1(or 4)-monophosphatase
MDKKNNYYAINTISVDEAEYASFPLQIAEKAARAGGEVVRRRFGQASAVHWKRGIEAQTPADVEAEKIIRELLVTNFPDDTISGEELGISTGTSPYTWVIDPLDGTSNFLLDIPQIAVCISRREQQHVLFTVIYQPIVDVLYVAQDGSGAYVNQEKISVPQRATLLEKSTVCSILTYEMHGRETTYCVINQLYRHTRRLLDTWAPSLDWCLLATGKIDALIYLSDEQMWLDPGMLAGAFFFLAAGGCMSDLRGNVMTDLTQCTSVIAAASASMIKQVCQVITDAPAQTAFHQNYLTNGHSR